MKNINRLYRHLGKHILDLSLCAPALILMAPVMAVIALLVHVKIGSPVIFSQQRPGLNGKPFTLFKFRTMTNARDSHGNLLPDSERLTPMGRFLRRFSLDELPELINVLIGDMSLVGPRPLLLDYLDRYSTQQLRRHEVKPGITGLSQVNGRQRIPFSKRIELDVEYVDNIRLGLDLKIVVLTIASVLRAQGVILGQDVREIDDLGLSQPLPAREKKSMK